MKQLKKLFLVILAIGCTLIASCKEEINFQQDPIAIENSFLQIRYSSASQDFTVAAPSQPTVSTTDSWINIGTISAAGDGLYTIPVTIDANQDGDRRKGTIKVSCDKASKVITISQDGRPQTQYASKAWDMIGSWRNGINIGNTLEATGGETSWGAALINTDYVHGIKAAGFDCVRIPCAWSIYMDNDNNIDTKWLDRVHEVIGYCINEGLYVVLNDHWDGGWLENDIPNGYSEVKAKKLKSMWTQIANKMADYDDHLLFAGFNEPNAEKAAEISTLHKYHQDFVDAVRATGGNNAERVLVLQAPNTSLELAHDYMQLPDDPADGCLAYEVHFYGPYQFVLMAEDADWSPTFWFWGEGNHVEGSEHNSNWGEEAWVAEQCALMKEKFASKGIPGIVGEYGCMVRSQLKGEEWEMHQRSRRAWSETVVRESKNCGMIPFNWDTPGGIINRVDGTVTDQEMVDAIMRGADDAIFPL